MIQNHKHYTYATYSSLLVDRFHTKTCRRFAFTYRCEISYQSEILALVKQPGWTHAGVTLAGMTFSAGIMLTKCRAMRGNRSELAPGQGDSCKHPQYSLWNQCPRMAKETWSRRSWRGRGSSILKIVFAEGGSIFICNYFFLGGGVKFWYTTLFWTPCPLPRPPNWSLKQIKFSLKLLCDFM